MKKDDSIKTFTIANLFSSNDYYVIPMYQRNYAWGEGEIEQLLLDISDSAKKNKGQEDGEKNYYLGTLVTYKRQRKGQVYYETIDGQQRLTTLIILLAYLKNSPAIERNISMQMKLDFENRDVSSETLKIIRDDNADFAYRSSYERNIKNAYEIIDKKFSKVLSECSVNSADFVSYLLDSTMLLRVEVPDDTDLNHYFEIMNNRGEQLEKHEILKAKFLSVINDESSDPELVKKYSYAFNKIWESCSNMNKYVQTGFSVNERNAVFGDSDWDKLTIDKFDDFADLLQEVNEQEEDDDHHNSEYCINKNVGNGSIIDDILKPDFNIKSDNKSIYEDQTPDRFTPVVNFQNFLLQVLRVQTCSEEIQLDDKRLILFFKSFLEGNHPLDFVKAFGFNLLRCKFLFDKYVIKREYRSGEDAWSLQRMKKYPQNKMDYKNTFENDERNGNYTNRRALMALAMFHVSTPTMVYKHWLNAVLYFLFYSKEKEIEVNNYIHYLEQVAKKFVLGRFLSRNPNDYYTLIYKLEKDFVISNDEIDIKKTSYHHIENNLLFNYLDYLLWCKEISDNCSDKKIKEFEFTARSSVEHYYPQNPIGDYQKLKSEYLHSFGNLCLISHSKNSKLSNFIPEQKIGYYNNSERIDSIKQYYMMQYNADEWGNDYIQKHEDEMWNVLLEGIPQ